MTIKTTTRFLAAVPALPVSDEQGTDEGLGFLRRTRSDPPVGPWRERAWRGAPPGESSSCRIEVTGVDELYKHCTRNGGVHPNATSHRSEHVWREHVRWSSHD